MNYEITETIKKAIEDFEETVKKISLKNKNENLAQFKAQIVTALEIIKEVEADA